MSDMLFKAPFRFIVVISTIIYYRFNFTLTPNKRLLLAITKLGPCFIKLGQFLSTRPDLVERDRAALLAKLQDKLPPFHLDSNIFIKELGSAPETLFASFDPIPVSAASVAQVHRATSHDGKQLAVKILRPNIDKQMKLDLAMFAWIAKLLDKIHKFKRLRLPDAIHELKQITDNELDLRLEAAAMHQMRVNFEQDSTVIIAKPYWNLTSQNIMTMDWIDGCSVSEANNKPILAATLVTTYFKQVYIFGFFHADMHQGNLLATADGKLALLDFGITCHINHETRIAVSQILYGFLKRDYQLVAKIHRDAGYIKPSTDLNKFALACTAIGEKFVGKRAGDISLATMLVQLFAVTESFDMATRPELLMLQKTMMIIEGVAQELDPEINIWQIIQPLIEDWMRKESEPKIVKFFKGWLK